MAPQSKLRDNIVDGNKLDLSMSTLTEVPVKDIVRQSIIDLFLISLQRCSSGNGVVFPFQAAIKKATILDLSNNQLTVLPVGPLYCVTLFLM